MEILQGFYSGIVFNVRNSSSLNPANVSITMQRSSSRYMNTRMLKQHFHQKGSPPSKKCPAQLLAQFPVWDQVSATPWSVRPVWSMYISGHMIHKALDTPLLHAWSDRRVWTSLHNSKELSVSDQLEHFWKEIPHRRIATRKVLGGKERTHHHPLTLSSFFLIPSSRPN